MQKKKSQIETKSPQTELFYSDEFSKIPVENTPLRTQWAVMYEFLHGIILWPSLLKTSQLSFFVQVKSE